jgi:hypothetical protein
VVIKKSPQMLVCGKKSFCDEIFRHKKPFTLAVIITVGYVTFLGLYKIPIVINGDVSKEVKTIGCVLFLVDERKHNHIYQTLHLCNMECGLQQK